MIYNALYRKEIRCLKLNNRVDVVTEQNIKLYNIEDHDLTPSDSSVIDFIKLCHDKVDVRPNCVVFALILKEKFPMTILYYDANHVITKIYGAFYDWNGIIASGRSLPLYEYGDQHLVNLLEATTKKL